MSKLALWFRRMSIKIENKNNEMRRAHGLPEDHRASEMREKLYRKRAEKSGKVKQ